MTLLGNRCLVKLAPADQPTTGGIVLAHAIAPAVCYGKVVQVGPKCADVEVGGIIAFPPSAGEDVDGFSTPHLIVKEADVLFTLERTA